MTWEMMGSVHMGDASYSVWAGGGYSHCSQTLTSTSYLETVSSSPLGAKNWKLISLTHVTELLEIWSHQGHLGSQHTHAWRNLPV